MLFRHKKRGGVYRILKIATCSETVTAQVVYEDTESLLVWTRPASEFFDGRFEVVLERKNGAPTLPGVTR